MTSLPAPPSHPPPPAPLRLRVLTLGDAQAGKTCLVKRFSEGRFPSRPAPATIGVDYGSLRVGGAGENDDDDARGGRSGSSGGGGGGGCSGGGRAAVSIDFFDTSGAPAYADVRSEFLGAADVALLVFDLSVRGALVGLARWARQVAPPAGGGGGRPPQPPLLVVVGAKGDLPRAVPEDEARAWALERGAPYFETSALTGQGVSQLFESVLATRH